MIHNERDLGVVKHFVEARLLHLADGNRTSDIVGQRQIDIRFDQLPCANAFQPRVLREDLCVIVMPITVVSSCPQSMKYLLMPLI